MAASILLSHLEMVRTFLAVAVVLVAGLWVWAPAQDDAPREIMWRKLDVSHDVLDALVLEDFEALEAYAEDLETLAVAGIFNILDTDEYRAHSEEFRTAARRLYDAARSENAEAGALAYWDLTLRCVRCHQTLGVIPQ